MQRNWQQLEAPCPLPQQVSILLLVFVCFDWLQPFDQTSIETDSIFPASKRHESEDILIKTGQPYQINLFSGVEHGFAVRADITKPTIRFAKESAFLQAVAWFEQYL
jgi:hypothetical protein